MPPSTTCPRPCATLSPTTCDLLVTSRRVTVLDTYSDLGKVRARSGTRTRTPFRTAAFEAAASAVPPSGRERHSVQASIYGGGGGSTRPLKLRGIELIRVDIPFRNDVATGAGVHSMRPLLFVRVVAEDAEGWGECAALAGGTAVDPPLDEVERAAVERGVPRLCEASRSRGGRLPLGAEVPQLFGDSPADRMLAAAFEMAVTDAELRAEGRPLADALGIEQGFESMAVGA